MVTKNIFAELLDRVRATVLEAQQHQSYPFDSLIRDLKVRRSTDRNPLFDVMVVMQDAVRPLFQTLSYILGTSVFESVAIVNESSLA